MIANGVHFMAVDKAKAKLTQLDEEYAVASAQLDEAIKMGDLRENAEYEIAKSAVQHITRERESVAAVMGMPIVRANDNIQVIEEGSVVKLTIHGVSSHPVKVGTKEFEEIKKQPPSFEGVLMYGATLSYQELLSDNALSVDTPMGKFLLGKQPGEYSIPVPAGFAVVTAEKLKTSTSPDELCCKL